MDKVFVIVHHLVADSGSVITVVTAKDKDEALEKYKKAKPHWHIGIDIQEITQDVQEVYRYDNPNYEG